MSDIDKQIAELQEKKKRQEFEAAKKRAYTVGDLIRDLSHFNPDTPIMRWINDPIEKDERLTFLDYDINNGVMWRDFDLNDHRRTSELLDSKSYDFRDAPKVMQRDEKEPA